MPILKKITLKSIFLLTVYAAFSFSAQPSATREYQVKSAFLFNFTHFIEWPSKSFSTAQSPVVIGILGKDPFGNYLAETIAGESIDKHPLVIQHYNTVEEITNCHILFIAINDKIKMMEAIEKLKGKNILTVSDANGFAKLGGMIRLYKKNDKINIQMNLEAIKAEDLVVSSKLLKLAEIVKTDKK